MFTKLNIVIVCVERKAGKRAVTRKFLAFLLFYEFIKKMLGGKEVRTGGEEFWTGGEEFWTGKSSSLERWRKKLDRGKQVRTGGEQIWTGGEQFCLQIKTSRMDFYFFQLIKIMCVLKKKLNLSPPHIIILLFTTLQTHCPSQ